jgi:hypothetical protein
MLFFVASMGYVRLELSIAPRTSTSLTALSSKRPGKLGHLINEIITTVTGVILPAVESKNAMRVAEAENAINALQPTIADVSRDPVLAEIAKELNGALGRLKVDGKRYAAATGDSVSEQMEKLAVRIEEVLKLLQVLASK